MEKDLRAYQADGRYSRSRENARDEGRLSLTGHALLTQFIVFIILGLTVFFLYRSGGAGFNGVRDLFSAVMQYDMTYSEIGNKIYSVFNQHLGEKPTVPASSRQEAVTGEESLEAETEAETEKSEESQAKTAEASTVAVTGVMGAGGEDLIYPKKNASFSPFYLSKPIVMPVDSKRTTSAFGYRINPVTKKYGFHSGLDIAAPEGADIKAAFDGVVEKASTSPARGNYIFLQSGNIKTVYCHCSKLLVKEGDAVQAGQVIAKVGHTGQATGPHLHFEIRINDVYCNPIWVLDFNGA